MSNHATNSFLDDLRDKKEELESLYEHYVLNNVYNHNYYILCDVLDFIDGSNPDANVDSLIIGVNDSSLEPRVKLDINYLLGLNKNGGIYETHYK